ncbi:substrate-binding periplasmic protein [Catenisphaera adipataccumulans]|jgi:ABC-type amino acid transport substrate-binding protein|uniref:Polar amino acid transport system substrate-binding protein n=1 Tax=Catenisphaera adipataccumulans TaxID=700500 RepID=A0A7W8FXA4_9FIRM|nr:transporter substrate-binding domain-containing protein [Catenisphaera adipataccumulans]MBB5183505.1 polar amino acid transport system substrate-binding protein [Catenisphaera adipataccumulans]
MKKLLKALLAVSMIVTMGGFAEAKSSKEKEVITVGISPDYKPYEYLTKKDKLTGFDVEMVEYFEDYLSEEEGKEVDFQFKQMDFDNIVTQIQGDQVDVGISGFTYSKKRKVEWSDPYLESKEVAVVPADSDISSLDDLEGKKLVAQTGSTGEEAAKSVKKADVTGLKDVQEIMNAVKANQYDAAIVDTGVAEQYASSGDYKVLDGALKDEKNYIIAKKGNKKMIKKINKCIAAFRASDEYQTLCDKYGLNPVTEEETE